MARRSKHAAVAVAMLVAGLATATPAHADTNVACSDTDLINAINVATRAPATP